MDTTKIIQALAYIASKQPDRTIDNIKAYKILWLSDRCHLRRYGRTISGDVYYAMPKGVVPTDAKNLLEGKKTRLKTDNNYFTMYIRPTENHKYSVISEPDTKKFSQSDTKVLDRVIERCKSLSGQELSEISHKFPEWTFYEPMLRDANLKNSYKIDIDRFFDGCNDDPTGLFQNENPEIVNLSKELYHQYNR